MSMKKGMHKNITVKKETYDELIRIKYARGFKTLGDVIDDLLEDEFEPLGVQD